MQYKRLIPNIVVPMAGLGTRFANAGYKDIKPMIPIFGEPMIKHVVDSIGINGNYIFIVQKNHREQYNLDEYLNKLRPGCKIIDTGGGVTEGAACSVLLAKEYINNECPLVIMNSDNIIDWNSELFYTSIGHELSSYDGLILCFKDTDPRWSFAKTDPDSNFVIEVAEKNPISDNATAGMYIWAHGKDFVRAAEKMIEKNIRVNNEFYICPVYNENILEGQKIIIGTVNKMHGVGTPEELERYINK